MFFAKPGEYEPCGIFTPNHFKLIIITSLFIAIALKFTIHKNKEQVHKIIKNMTIIIWLLEVVIIVFSLKYNSLKNVNEYLPLYYCSLLLYAGFLSSFTKGKLKRVGDVFLATGGIIGGIVFMLLPTTSLPTYPAMHFISIHSYFFHGTMVYLGLLINITHYIELQKRDIIYFSCLVGIICVVSYIVNIIFDSNLMFISKDFPGTPIHIIYKFTGPLFTFVMSVGQMTLPFYIVYGITKLINKFKLKQKNANEEKVLINNEESNEKLYEYNLTNKK